MGVVLLVICLAGGLVGLSGWVVAHARRTPPTRPDDLGPLHRAFPVGAPELRAVIVRQATRMRGVSVAQETPTAVVLDVRPSAARLDDAMGLFVTITFADGQSQVPGQRQGWYQVTGQAKSRIAIASSSAMALREFERDLRMGMKRSEGLTALGAA